jgi:hypothetical protein
MADPVGFAILSHGDQRQLRRLVDGLNLHYGNPPIACHHDFSQAPLDATLFPSNVRFVVPSYRTGWGRWSVVEGGLKAIQLLYEDGGPNWFFLLSAADYPIRKPSAVLEELASTPFDAFSDARPLLPAVAGSADIQGHFNPKLAHFSTEKNQTLKRTFYRSPQFWMPIIRRVPRWRPGKLTYRPDFPSPFHPYRNGIACLYGDHWFTANRKAARVLLEQSPLRQALSRHLRHRSAVDETFYQTVLCNHSALSICRDNRRFAEWNGGGAHPMLLGEAQLGEALASGAFFARKFAAGSPLLDRIDELLRAG